MVRWCLSECHKCYEIDSLHCLVLVLGGNRRVVVCVDDSYLLISVKMLSLLTCIVSYRFPHQHEAVLWVILIQSIMPVLSSVFRGLFAIETVTIDVVMMVHCHSPSWLSCATWHSLRFVPSSGYSSGVCTRVVLVSLRTIQFSESQQRCCVA